MSAAGALCRDGTPGFADEMILAAPDVSVEHDNDDFEHLLKRGAPCIRRTTIYASDNDLALMVSEGLHGGIPRAGRMPEQSLRYVAQNYGGKVDVVDASMAPGDPFGHGYFVLSYELMADATGVLAGVSASDRAGASGAPTLFCLNLKDAPCPQGQDSQGQAFPGRSRFVLAVTKAREPDWTSRLLRHIWPLVFPVQ